MLTWQSTTGMEAIDHVGDGTLATLHNVMHQLCGPDWRPSEVWFAHRRPVDVGPYRRFFRVPLRFDAEQYALLFSAGFLKRRLPGIDDELRGLLERQIELLQDRHPDDFPEQVRSLLRTALLTGQSRADQVAALLGMHSRTLNRRLNAFGVGFQQLVEETRFEIARQMLEYSTIEIAHVADSLG
jgi:AraC-like DNA-binding protein